MPLIEEQLELERSREFFTDPHSYTAFDLNDASQKILGCIDPRDQEDLDRLLTLVQTPGGGVGNGVDRAIVGTALNEDGEVTNVEEGLVADRNEHHAIKLGAHHNCRFIKGLLVVLDEMAEPSDFTESGAQHWTRYYRYEDEITASTMGRVQDAVKKLREEKHEEAELLENVDRLYATRNVVNMVGENTARFYVVNHHPNVGLDRHKKHREERLVIQGYHDSFGATMADYASRFRGDKKALMLGTHILKAAAVRSVIGDESTFYYEAHMDEYGRGLKVIQVERSDA